MTAVDSSLPSLADRVRTLQTDASVVAAHFLGAVPVFVLGEEAMLFAPREEEPRRIAIHNGGILASTGDGERIVSGGDDGKVIATTADGEHTVVAADPKSRWIDHVALAFEGAIAWSAGKTASVRTKKGEERTLDAPSTVAGLAFAPKGFRLAVAHYNGATLWFPNAPGAKPEVLEWKGSHLGVTFSPDGRFLVTTMQEPTLHGWRVADGKHMRMSGYSARVRSLSWSSDGNFLATSGSEQLILWPFDGKEGPMGRQPTLMAQDAARVAVVACHPRQPVAAVGYANGKVLLVRTEDGALISVRDGDGDPVSALAWEASGQTLAYGTEGGAAGVLVF
ncbi:MAG TPA: WD40 repeat domain-containing protein [Pseudolabrys sp.]|nr:WD40 repeat domain-containing protein [Pseudolabrys sp.]